MNTLSKLKKQRYKEVMITTRKLNGCIRDADTEVKLLLCALELYDLGIRVDTLGDRNEKH